MTTRDFILSECSEGPRTVAQLTRAAKERELQITYPAINNMVHKLSREGSIEPAAGHAVLARSNVRFRKPKGANWTDGSMGRAYRTVAGVAEVRA